MEEIPKQPEEGMNPQPVEVPESTPEGEPGEAPAPVKTYSESEFKQVLARAKKAEEELKTIKDNPKPTDSIIKAPSQETIEETVLKSQGMKKELLDELKTIAKVRGVGLIEAQTDPIFVEIKRQNEAKDKSEKARLGASRGSGTVKKEKTISSPGLTDAEHKELWKQHVSGN